MMAENKKKISLWCLKLSYSGVQLHSAVVEKHNKGMKKLFWIENFYEFK